MLNITNHQNENQNLNETPPHTCQNGYYQNRQQIPSAGNDVEKTDHCQKRGEWRTYKKKVKRIKRYKLPVIK